MLVIIRGYADLTCMRAGQLVVSSVRRAYRLDVIAGWSMVARMMNSRGRQMCALLPCIPRLVGWGCFDG